MKEIIFLLVHKASEISEAKWSKKVLVKGAGTC